MTDLPLNGDRFAVVAIHIECHPFERSPCRFCEMCPHILQQLLHDKFVMLTVPLQAQRSFRILKLLQHFEYIAVASPAVALLISSLHLSDAVDCDRFQPCPKRSGSLTVELGNAPCNNRQDFLDSIVRILFLQPDITPQPTADQRRINSQQPRPCLAVGLPSNAIQKTGGCFSHNALKKHFDAPDNGAFILRAARNEPGERSGVSPPVPRFCTGKLTHAARRFPHS